MMKNIVMIFGTIVMFSSLMALPIIGSDWKITDEYNIRFFGTGAEGSFQGLKGTVVFDPFDLDRSYFDVTVDAGTISTGNKTKDKHARGSSWFDVDNYPVIGFRSTAFYKAGASYQVKGILDMHGVKREITIPFTFSESPYSGLFQGNVKIDRKDFKITGPFFGFVVGDEFDVSLEVPVSK